MNLVLQHLDLNAVIADMRGPNGIEIQHRRYRFRTYTQCFVDSHAVQWLRNHLQVSRQTAVQIGQRLIDEGYIHHVLDEQSFDDTYFFYRFYSDEGHRKCPCCAEIIQLQAKICRYCGCSLTPQPHCIKASVANQELHQALVKEEFQVFYQPIFYLESSRLYGFEALLRWQHPTLGLLPPSEFIPLAEETGFIKQLDRWVIGKTVPQIQAWQVQFNHPQISISVNISAQQVSEAGLVTFLKSCLDHHLLGPNYLNLEITETGVIHNHQVAKQRLQEIRQLGVQISADDFGTGYSSLRYLHDFPINIVKIDRTFVGDIEHNLRSLEVIRAVISLAHSLGIRVVAEGIEKSAQLTILQALQCELGQGYYFAKPLSVTEVEELLKRQVFQ